MIATENLSFSYGDKSVINDVSFNAERGKVLGIVGPNGSGKSTLIRLIQGSIRPDSGQVMIDGLSLNNAKPRELAQMISVVVQEHESVSGYTAAEMVLLGRYQRSNSFQQISSEDRKIVSESLDRVGLLNQAKSSFADLSGGEQQRVRIARALAQDTPYLLLDEPTNHLDIHYQHQLLSLIQGLGRTVVVVLHDLNLAARYCDKIAVLNQGTIVSHGSPSEVFTEALVESIYRLRTERYETDFGMQLIFKSTV